MSNRREARIKALEILYQNEITDEDIPDIIEVRKKDNKKNPEFSVTLVNGVIKNKNNIDKQIAYASDRWTLDRMPLVDRNVLRIACYEIIYEDKIPVSVSINEAVEIAKEYGTADSSKFVNGILGSIANEKEGKKNKE